MSLNKKELSRATNFAAGPGDPPKGLTLGVRPNVSSEPVA
jgi:hypothetical protein